MAAYRGFDVSGTNITHGDIDSWHDEEKWSHAAIIKEISRQRDELASLTAATRGKVLHAGFDLSGSSISTEQVDTFLRLKLTRAEIQASIDHNRLWVTDPTMRADYYDAQAAEKAKATQFEASLREVQAIAKTDAPKAAKKLVEVTAAAGTPLTLGQAKENITAAAQRREPVVLDEQVAFVQEFWAETKAVTPACPAFRPPPAAAQPGAQLGSILSIPWWAWALVGIVALAYPAGRRA